jgi:hypothetical protein
LDAGAAALEGGSCGRLSGERRCGGDLFVGRVDSKMSGTCKILTGGAAIAMAYCPQLFFAC